jgi:Domain of Unknown Function (DUF1080)
MSRLFAASLCFVLFATPSCFVLFATPSSARSADNELTPEDRGAGWTLLFDGKTLDGWIRSDGKPSNRGVDHEAINPHRCGAYMLVYDKEFSNFELKCDFKVTPNCNSGIFVRTYPLTPRKGRDVGYNGIEIAIDDGIKEGYHATGAIYDLSPVLVDATKPTGQWNHIEIKCDKSEITVELNGKQVNTVDLDKFTKANVRPDNTPHKFDVAYKDHPKHGYIGLQDHGSPCWFKNIKLRELK